MTSAADDQPLFGKTREPAAQFGRELVEGDSALGGRGFERGHQGQGFQMPEQAEGPDAS